jgi:hypothetical protein
MEHDGQGMSRGIGYVVLGIAWGVTGLRYATYRGEVVAGCNAERACVSTRVRVSGTCGVGWCMMWPTRS